MDEENFDSGIFTEPVVFKIDDSSVGWVPGEDFLVPVYGPQAVEIVDSVDVFIAQVSNSGENIQVTPEGPNLPGSSKNLYTVVWAIETLFSERDISYEGGAHPTLADLGLDDASGYDKYGNPLIR